MVYFNKEKAKEKTLNYLRYPIPRTPVSVTRHLKKELKNFYPKTEDYRATKKTKKHILKPLNNKNLIIRYTDKEESWKDARELLKKHREARNKPKPRKLNELYQINFFYLGKDTYIYKLPKLKEINLEIVALLYNITQGEQNKNFFWNILNLFHCYSNEKYKGKIRVKIYGSQFTDKESKTLDKLLEYHNEMEKVLNKLPFKPDIERCQEFLEKL